MAALQNPNPFFDPKAIVQAGERIYREKYQQQFEATHMGKFVAIDVNSEQAYLGDTPEDALFGGLNESPEGVFHLIKVGALAAIHMSTISDGSSDWLHQ